jgi:cytochrome c peroxidase
MVSRMLVSCTIGALGAATLLGCAECPRAVGLNTKQCAAVATWKLPEALPAAIGNAKADDEAAALLGFSLFFDARFSRTEQVRCATCHIPERAFTDGLSRSKGLAQVDRNSPSIYSAAWHRWQMWDGRADSVWSQPLLAFENPLEMDLTRLELAHKVASLWGAKYVAVFGALPPLDDAARFPARGKPGDAAFDGMAPADQLEINRVAANVGKAIEAYERRAAHRGGRFDAFLAGDEQALTALERQGLGVFFKAGCDECHQGPTLSDDAFHAVGVPAVAGKVPERGRSAALEQLAASPFTVEGVFHDGAPVAAAPAPGSVPDGLFRTPTLRNVARTGPWGHNGVFDTLAASVDFHLTGGGPGSELKPVLLSDQDHAALLGFLEALNSSDPPAPWNTWPDR